MNEKLVREEDELINEFIKRYEWDMKKTGTGLRYMIYSAGAGSAARERNKATIHYSVVLLNGDTCYTAVRKEFIVGKGQIEAGLDEGVRMMHVGDKAKFILPSHLAFGLIGDHQSIPQKATLVYDVYLLEVNDI
ncbi:MAG TPA: FKBP-type peptidyl-prolyl cis-trans isomerase [Bacteroidales bacterium]|nr:FKBP-type peptidyl-prolyl cis-trans isomerase [Bacteroidales bacterium]HNS45640.1 FKBP-type peptidyl-prolyl cis-trans isomerase [Bacteroidales bacterium]